MSVYLLDSPLLTAYLRGRQGAVSLMDPWIQQQIAAVCAVSYGEATEYIQGFADYQRHRIALRELLRQIHVYNYSYNILDRCASLRRALRPPYGPGLIGDIHTLIAATALEYNLTMVTADSDFQRVPGLALMLIPRAQLKA